MKQILFPAAYLLGSISFGLLVVGRGSQRDLRQVGSGNTGATNVLRAAGKKAAILVLCLDILKGALPVAVGKMWGADATLLGATAVAAVVGHMFPVFHGFRGGKGVATAAGALGALRPELLALAAAVFAVLAWWTRYVSLASMAGVSTYAVAALVSGDRVAPAAAAIAILVVVRHRANIARLWRGEERRLGGARVLP